MKKLKWAVVSLSVLSSVAAFAAPEGDGDEAVNSSVASEVAVQTSTSTPESGVASGDSVDSIAHDETDLVVVNRDPEVKQEEAPSSILDWLMGRGVKTSEANPSVATSASVAEKTPSEMKDLTNDSKPGIEDLSSTVASASTGYLSSLFSGWFSSEEVKPSLISQADSSSQADASSQADLLNLSAESKELFLDKDLVSDEELKEAMQASTIESEADPFVSVAKEDLEEDSFIQFQYKFISAGVANDVSFFANLTEETRFFVNALMTVKGAEGKTPLTYAAEQGWVEFVSGILEMKEFHGKDADLKLAKTTPLHAAVFAGKYSVVELLMTRFEYEVSNIDARRRTPLFNVIEGLEKNPGSNEEYFKIFNYLLPKVTATTLLKSECSAVSDFLDTLKKSIEENWKIALNNRMKEIGFLVKKKPN